VCAFFTQLGKSVPIDALKQVVDDNTK